MTLHRKCYKFFNTVLLFRSIVLPSLPSLLAATAEVKTRLARVPWPARGLHPLPGQLEELSLLKSQRGSHSHKPATETGVDSPAAKRSYCEKRCCRNDSPRFCLQLNEKHLESWSLPKLRVTTPHLSALQILHDFASEY